MIKSEMRTVRLGDLLTKEQANRVGELLEHENPAGLRSYLQSIGSELEAKGVLADYLYYYLLYIKPQIDKESA